MLFLRELLFGKNNVLKNKEIHIQYILPAVESSEKIIRLMQNNAQITIKELAEQVGISTRAIEKNIAKLKSQNHIERIGGAKGGFWKIIEK